MIINPYIVGGYLPEAVSLFGRMSVQPSSGLKTKINEAIASLQDAGIWEKLDSLYWSILSETSQASTLDWIRPTKSASFTGAAAWDNAFGFTSETGSYVDTDYNPASEAVNVTQNSWSSFIWCSSLPDNSVGSSYHPMIQRAGSSLQLRCYDFDYRTDARANIASISATAAECLFVAEELYTVGRDSSTSSGIYKGNTLVKTSATASSAWTTTTEAYTVRLMEFSTTDIVGGVGVWGMGSFLDATDLGNLKTIITDFLL